MGNNRPTIPVMRDTKEDVAQVKRELAVEYGSEQTYESTLRYLIDLHLALENPRETVDEYRAELDA